jgi:translocation and assembly module TamA
MPSRHRPHAYLSARVAAFAQLLPVAVLSTLLVFGIAPRAWADVSYSTYIQLEGVKDSALITNLRDVSQLVKLEDHPPPTEAALRRRAEGDLPRLKEVVQAAGYWTPQLSFAFETEDEKLRVLVTVDPGPLFHVASVTFRDPSGGALLVLDQLGPAAFGLTIGGPALSAPVAAAEQQIVETYARNGHPFAKVIDHRAVVDVAKDTMSVTYTVDPGSEARFGGVTITGLQRVNRGYVEARIAWRPGERYDARAVEKTRQDLVRSALFSSVLIRHADAPDAAGQVAMTVDLVEGPPRSIGAGVAYSTNLGVGAQAFWEHRNLFGNAENLRVTADVAQRQLGLALAFRKPDFIDRDQDLLSSAALLQENTDAYRSSREQVYTGLERRLLPSITASAGLSFEHANVQSNITGSEDYALLGTPLFLRRDTTDDLLDPTIGSRQTLTLIPYHSVSGPDLNFVSSRIEARDYERLTDSGRLILAGFAAFGSIFGATRDEVPPDKRLYAGGAGSVRAYAYQRAGPLGPGEVPLGGISSLELGLELRYRITETIGIAPFIEGGNVYPHSIPDSLTLFYGGGIGFRYYTLIGPIRIDLATPFTRRPGDNPVQFYISIGQAF